jgi:AcrR family transcriptional regulator
MNDPGGLSKRADVVTNRARLLAVAQAVFAESGLDLEVSDIASQAQLGVGTLYRHLGNREDILRAIVTRILEDAQAQIRQAIEPYADDPRAALQALVSTELRVHQQHRPLLATMRDRRLAKLFDPAHQEAMQAQILDLPRWVIERGIRVGVFRENLDPDLAAATIIGSVASVFEFLGKRDPLDELEQQLTQMLWTMFTK